MFNYDLTIGNKTEFQRGSGLLIGTPAGSYAWLKSAKGKVLKLGCRKWQFIARELYEHNLTKNYQLEKGILNDDDNVKILIKTPGILVMDSVSDVYELKKGDIVDISVSRYDLKYVDV